MRLGNMEIECGAGILGAIIALIVLILAVLLFIFGQLDPVVIGMLAALAFARLT